MLKLTIVKICQVHFHVFLIKLEILDRFAHFWVLHFFFFFFWGVQHCYFCTCIYFLITGFNLLLKTVVYGSVFGASKADLTFLSRVKKKKKPLYFSTFKFQIKDLQQQSVALLAKFSNICFAIIALCLFCCFLQILLLFPHFHVFFFQFSSNKLLSVFLFIYLFFFVSFLLFFNISTVRTYVTDKLNKLSEDICKTRLFRKAIITLICNRQWQMEHQWSLFQMFLSSERLLFLRRTFCGTEQKTVLILPEWTIDKVTDNANTQGTINADFTLFFKKLFMKQTINWVRKKYKLLKV